MSDRFPSIMRITVEVYGRDVTVMAGSRLMTLPSGSILILPPAEMHLTPVEITADGDSRGHPELIQVEPVGDGPFRNAWKGEPVKSF